MVRFARSRIRGEIVVSERTPVCFDPTSFQALVSRDPDRAGKILSCMRARWRRVQAEATVRYLAKCGTETSVEAVIEHYDGLIALSHGGKRQIIILSGFAFPEPVPVIYEPLLLDRLTSKPAELRELLRWLSPRQREGQAIAMTEFVRCTRNLRVSVRTLLAAWAQLDDMEEAR